MLQTDGLEIKLDSIPPAILPAFSLQKKILELIAHLRGFVTHMIDGFLKNPYVVPLIIMVTMLFFSYRTTFVYFRF